MDPRPHPLASHPPPPIISNTSSSYTTSPILQPSDSRPHHDDSNRQHTLLAPHHTDHQHNLRPLPQPHRILGQSAAGRFTEEWDASQRGSSIIDGPTASASRLKALDTMQRSNSIHSYAAGDDERLSIRGNNTLKKKASLRRSGSLRRRSSSRRSNRAGSVRSLAMQSPADPRDVSSAFYCPVPTSGAPTDALAARFQTWRKVLKDVITYFREIQSHYDNRAKALVKLSNVANNISTPPTFLRSAGLDDALQFLRKYNSIAIQEANKAKEIEEDVILALTGLRSDLQQKIKEIKHLSGDFKNSVDKEMDGTRKAVEALADVLDKTDIDSAATTGKQDPYLMRLAVDRQVERQIDEENYLHQAYLNLEGSGRELESIVVGEIQKAYNAYAGILKREAENAFNAVEELREGPISMPKDQEWNHFVTHDEEIVDPTIPMRSPEQIHYPGQDHVSAQEIRAGLLERKSKYLKSYTAGWYVLSTTHLHEFKSADKAQAPVMSLYLPEQKLGSHSTEGGSSNKFVLKGRQTGAMHRGHTWVFRAESHDTMMAWYEDIKALTEKSPAERSQFVRSHSRSLSQSSRRSASSDGMVDDEDEEPFSANQMDVAPEPRTEPVVRRPEPGGRFPSDMQVNAQRGLQAPQSPSSVSSGRKEYTLDANALSADTYKQQARDRAHEPHTGYGETVQSNMDSVPSQAAIANHEAYKDGVNPYTSEPQYQSSQQEHNALVAPVVATQGQPEPVAGSTMAPQVPQEYPHGYYDDERRRVDAEVDEYERRLGSSVSAATTGPAYINGGVIGSENERVIGMTAGSIPRSETQQELALQSSHEGSVPSPMVVTNTPLASLQRPAEERTASANTISNLPMPGKYPKGNGIASP
ncbi:hypothetical protein HIM_08199 [Hirsutella minnesotensis 3608]|uniref:PH domain-containing protein n=1 Tax=Hirsutella minnesotensis 3608 TaxID=1043627 RepID=A0A0F7ZHC4_9HYPO|nr:hypothetical protein HIM_08199 [Hirsutella minnesotensis 3608]